MWSPNDSSLTENKVLQFLLLEIICIVLMVMDHSAKIATPIRTAISTLTYPLIKVVELPQNAYAFLSSSVSNQQQLLKQNINLKQQLSQAQIDLLQLEVISQQNSELRQLLHAKQQLPLKTTAAFLININTSDNNHHFIINQGYNQGVTNGQVILDLNGVAGQVYSVDLESSHVILITNENHALPVEFLRSGVRTYVYGTGDLETLVLPEIPQSASVEIDDILITSGFGGVFPRGLKVATIKSIIDSSDKSFKQAEAQPSANLNLLKQVLLVWSDKDPAIKKETIGTDTQVDVEQ